MRMTPIPCHTACLFEVRRLAAGIISNRLPGRKRSDKCRPLAYRRSDHPSQISKFASELLSLRVLRSVLFGTKMTLSGVARLRRAAWTMPMVCSVAAISRPEAVHGTRMRSAMAIEAPSWRSPSLLLFIHAATSILPDLRASNSHLCRAVFKNAIHSFGQGSGFRSAHIGIARSVNPDAIARANGDGRTGQTGQAHCSYHVAMTAGTKCW
jgi:hypothetical protein